MKIAIVGSRRRLDQVAVAMAVGALPPGTVVVSGGCRGVDSWAAAAARDCGLAVIEHLPDLRGVKSYGQAVARYYERNQRIIDDADRVIAFPAPDRKGGTEDTIRRAQKAGKPITIL